MKLVWKLYTLILIEINPRYVGLPVTWLTRDVGIPLLRYIAFLLVYNFEKMFKKLKKKIEEGETGTPEKIYSSPYAYQKTPEKKAFPGLPVRLPSTSEIQEDNVSVSEQSYKEGSGASEDTNEILHGLGSDRETTKGSSNDRPTENTASVLPQVDGRRDALHSQQNDTVLKQEDEIQNSSSQSLPPPPLQSLPPPPLQSLPPPPSTTSTSGLSSLGSKALEFTGIIRGSDSALHQQVLGVLLG